jgi:phospholipid/cholesterol/gamma-HCH transport system substrate-binding protein
MVVRYPVIASQLSQVKQMLTSVDRIMTKIEQVDLKGISDQIKETSRAMETFLAGKKTTGILGKLDATAGSIEQGMRRIDRILAEGRVEGVLDATRQGIEETRQGVQEARQGLQEARKTIADARELVAAAHGEVKNIKVSETVDRAGRLLEEIDRRTRGMKTDFERTTEDIRQAAEKLNLLLDRLQANPSDLIFSRPPVDDGPRMEEAR